MSIVSINRHIMIRPLNGRIILYNKKTKKAYSIGKNEYAVLALIDGKRTIAQICGLVHHYSCNEISQLIAKFDDLGLLNGNKPLKKRRLNPLMLKFALAYPKHGRPNAADALYTFFIKYLSLPTFVLGIVTFLLLKNHSREVITDIPFIVSAVSILIAITLHELSHAAAAKKEGAIVAEIGVGLMCCFIPCMYTSIIAVDRLEKKSSRILVYASGMLLNLALIGISALTSIFVNKALSGCLLIFANLNFFLVLINLNFFFRTDTYSILAEVFNDRMLRERSFAYLFTLFKKSPRIISAIPQRKKILYIAFSLSSILILLIVSLISIIAFINVIKYLMTM